MGDSGYDAARRVWNGMVDKRPALIARCVGTADVLDCVRFAREHDVLVSVRGGGHNYDRVVALKKKYDPTNFLTANQNVNLAV